MFWSTFLEQLISAVSLQWHQGGEKLFLIWAVLWSFCKSSELFVLEIIVNFFCPTMSFSQMTEIDILAKYLIILMYLITVLLKLTNHFHWYTRNHCTLEKQSSIMTACSDEQKLLQKKELSPERCSGIQNKSKEDCTVVVTRK